MSAKSSKSIERDIFRMLKSSELSTLIGGTFYRDGMRKIDSQSEDAVVKFLTGVDGQAQEGVVLLHIYVPDIDIWQNGAYVENIQRIETLEETVMSALNTIESTEYLLETDGTPQSYVSQDYNGQHFINVRIKYKRTTLNL